MLNSTHTSVQELSMSGWNRRFFWQTCVLFVGLCSLHLLAQTPATEKAPQRAAANDAASPQSSSQPGNPNPTLGAGDLIVVTVFGVPDLSTRARISSTGDVYLPLIDYVHVDDLTTDEAQDLIQKRLEDGGFVRNPHVTIFVEEAASQAITMLGEIGRPGPYPAIGKRRLFDMISLAGGLTDRAGRNVTIMHHGNSDQKTELKLPENLAEDTQNNVEVFPGDAIFFSRAGIVYVVGDVPRPSGFRIEGGSLTVLKAFALAGGGTKTASLNGTRIVRQTPNGVQEIPVHLKKILHAKEPDMALMKDDVLFVPGSAAKTAAYRTSDTAFGLASAASIYAIHP
jgi:polysaccharide export outer membrane protein